MEDGAGGWADTTEEVAAVRMGCAGGVGRLTTAETVMWRRCPDWTGQIGAGQGRRARGRDGRNRRGLGMGSGPRGWAVAALKLDEGCATAREHGGLCWIYWRQSAAEQIWIGSPAVMV